MRSAMLSLGRNRPAPKHSGVPWWEGSLRAARLSSDRPHARASALGPFATPPSGRGSAVTTEDPLLRHLAMEASRIGELHYVTAGNVVLSSDARAKLRRIADEYYERTGRDLYITSGSCTPKKQVEVMYDNFANHRNQNPPYRDRLSFKEIEAVYDLGMRQSWGRTRTIEAMTSIIENQIAHGRYIPRHLRGEGVDVRIRDMTLYEKRAFEKAVDHILGLDARGHHRWFLETDHYHVQF